MPSVLWMPSVFWHCWLGGRKSIRSVKNMSEVVLAWLSVWREVQTICIWSSWCHCHPIISCFIKIQNGSTFWCHLTQVVVEKRLLNGRSSSSMFIFLLRKCIQVFIYVANSILYYCCWQILLPTQTFHTHWLTFSPVEEHFYRQQYYICAREAMTVTIHSMLHLFRTLTCLFCCKFLISVFIFLFFFAALVTAFSALTLLVGRQKEHPACK